MTKDNHWFKHDYNARRDPKLIRLARIKGMKGIGIYWSLIEIMHEQEGSIGEDELSDICFELRADDSDILSVLNEFDLFVKHPHYYSNTRVLCNIDERRGTSEVARKNVKARWDRYRLNKLEQMPDRQEDNTPVLPKTYDSNTTREEDNREDKKIVWEDFISGFNKITGRNFRGGTKVKSQLSARSKEGYTLEQILKATHNCFSTKFHKENPQHLSPEFILRADKLDKYLNYSKPFISPPIIAD